MSLLNYSTYSINQSVIRQDILTFQSIEESFSFRNENESENFKESFEGKLKSLENHTVS